MTEKSKVLQGTFDLMILKTLQLFGPKHGFGIAKRIEQVSRDVLSLNEGRVYASLLLLEQEGSIAAKWGLSENNRQARYYSMTKAASGNSQSKRRIGNQFPALLRACSAFGGTNSHGD